MPVLEEAPGIEAALDALQRMRGRGAEILVVDGGSRDGTPELAAAGADRVLASAPGRAFQMNAGARQARGEMLLFLHADTTLPGDADRRIRRALADRRRAWGRFDVRLSGRHPALRVIEAAMNARSRWTGIATGDQALFVARPLFEAVGGFPEIPLMEDVALAARLRRHGRPACLRARVTTSSRRWERDGIARTVLLMWWLRLAFRLGVPPARLHAWYYGARAGA